MKILLKDLGKRKIIIYLLSKGYLYIECTYSKEWECFSYYNRDSLASKPLRRSNTEYLPPVLRRIVEEEIRKIKMWGGKYERR